MAMQPTESEPDIKTDPTGRGDPQRPPSFRERHGLKVMGAIMAILFAVVIAVQVAC